MARTGIEPATFHFSGSVFLGFPLGATNTLPSGITIDPDHSVMPTVSAGVPLKTLGRRWVPHTW